MLMAKEGTLMCEIQIIPRRLVVLTSWHLGEQRNASISDSKFAEARQQPGQGAQVGERTSG